MNCCVFGQQGLEEPGQSLTSLDPGRVACLSVQKSPDRRSICTTYIPREKPEAVNDLGEQVGRSWDIGGRRLWIDFEAKAEAERSRKLVPRMYYNRLGRTCTVDNMLRRSIYVCSSEKEKHSGRVSVRVRCGG